MKSAIFGKYSGLHPPFSFFLSQRVFNKCSLDFSLSLLPRVLTRGRSCGVKTPQNELRLKPKLQCVCKFYLIMQQGRDPPFLWRFC